MIRSLGSPSNNGLKKKVLKFLFPVNALALAMMSIVFQGEFSQAADRCQTSLNSKRSTAVGVYREFNAEEIQVIDELVSLILAGQEEGQSHYRPEIVHSLLKEKQMELVRKVGREKTRKLFLEVQHRVLSKLSIGQSQIDSEALRSTNDDNEKQRIKIAVLRSAIVREFAHRSEIESAVFSPDGKYALTASNDRTAMLWDVASGRPLRSFAGHRQGVFSAVFSPDGKYVLTASLDGTARLWDISNGLELSRFVGHKHAVTSAKFSPDGRFILTASGDKTSKLWDVASALEITRRSFWKSSVITRGLSLMGLNRVYKPIQSFIGHDEWVRSAVFSPDGKYVLTASDDRTARLWDISNGREIYSFKHAEGVNSAVFSPDGKYVLTASNDGAARLWDVSTKREVYSFVGHSGSIESAVFSPDGKLVLAVTYDGMAKIWEVAGGALVQNFEKQVFWINTGVFSPDGRYVLTASGDWIARLWSLYQDVDATDLSGDDISAGGSHD